MFLIPLPEGFVPEEHGWHRIYPYLPEDQAREEEKEMAHFGRIHRHWHRYRIPYLFPAALAEVLHGEITQTIGAFYGEPMWSTEQDDFQMTQKDIYRHLRGEE